MQKHEFNEMKPAPLFPNVEFMQAPSQEPHDWRGILENLKGERSFTGLQVEGTIPPELQGLFLRNGPSNRGNHGVSYGHWFDGDGAVSGVRFGQGKAEGAVQIVKTPEYAEEQEAQRILYPGFGTQVPGFLKRTKIKNVANTNLLYWQNRLFALWEGGQPTEISLEDLSTLGRTDIDGTIRGAFSAHYHRVHARGAAYNFGVNLGIRPSLDLYVFPDRGPPRHLKRVALSANLMLHDFMVTQRYALFLVSPVHLKMFPFLFGKGSFADNLSWEPQQGTEVICISLDDPDEVIRFETEPFYQWHFANAFDDDGQLIVDLVQFDSFQLVGWAEDLETKTRGVSDFGRLVRATICPQTRTYRDAPFEDFSCEFPTVAPRVAGAEHQYIYLCKHSAQAEQDRTLFDQIAKVDVKTGEVNSYQFEKGCVGSEPVFAPRAASSGAEDHGFLLSLVYDPGSHTSHVLILDASEIERGPLAKVHFPEHIPYTFHGIWVPGKTT